jgi:hypothetical protein
VGRRSRPVVLQGLARGDRCSDFGDRPEQNQGIILRGNEPAALPEICGLDIDGIDHQRATTDQSGSCCATPQSMPQKPGANPLANPILIRRKLAQKQARDGIWRLTGTDRARQHGRQDRGGRKTVIADSPIGFMDDKNCRKALLLIGERTCLQPSIRDGLPQENPETSCAAVISSGSEIATDHFPASSLDSHGAVR